MRMRPEAETSGRGQPRPWSTSLILTWVFDVDTLTAFVDLVGILRQRTYRGEAVKGQRAYTVQSERGRVVLHNFLPGELSFQWSMKRAIQATLTGEAFKAKPVYGESSVGSGNQTLYGEFVDAFCRVSPRACAVAISEAQDEWRKVRSNRADVRRRIDELNAMAQKAKRASGWKVTISASPQPSSLSDRSASARSSVECSFLEEARSVKTTSCRQNLYFLVCKKIFSWVPICI